MNCSVIASREVFNQNLNNSNWLSAAPSRHKLRCKITSVIYVQNKKNG